MQTLTKTGLSALALVAALAIVPADITAQDQPIGGEQACTVEFQPQQVAAGSNAVPVTITVSEPIGPVTGLNADEMSGIKLATAADLPRTEMAAGEEQPQPIRMGEGENTWIVWLNLAEAQEGTHELSFTSTQGECAGSLEVRPRG